MSKKFALNFCVANEISCANALIMLEKAYDDSVLPKTRPYEWYKAFQEGREIVEDMPRSGRPSTSTTQLNVYAMKQMMLEKRHTILREVENCLNIFHELVRTILTEHLDMRRVAARVVPKELNFLQKKYRKQVSLDMLDCANSDSIFMERQIWPQPTFSGSSNWNCSPVEPVSSPLKS